MPIGCFNMRIPAFIFLCAAFCGPLRAQNSENPAELYARGAYEDALEVINAQTDADITPDLLKLKADCLQKMDEFSLALDYYDRARLRGYLFEDLYLCRGICRISLGQYDLARLDLIHYSGARPGEAKTYYWLATIEYFEMNNRKSIELLDECVYIDSTYAAAYFLRAANYRETNKPTLAVEDFMTAYALNTSLHQAKLYAAVTMLDMEHYQNAIELFSEVNLEGSRFNAEALYYRGEARYRMHDFEGACVDWSEAASLGDMDAAENYRRVCADRKGGPKFKRRTFGAF
jgi:hypothetical protein